MPGVKPRCSPASRARLGSRGMTLVEVLVALLVFSVGLVGMAALQARALRYSNSAEDTNRAALLANEIAAQMLMNQNVVLPSARIAAWRARVADPTGSGLPNGDANVSVDGTGLATITIQWRSPNAASGAANAQSRYVTQFRVVN
jgi:type IV pilus assembly protein PilV